MASAIPMSANDVLSASSAQRRRDSGQAQGACESVEQGNPVQEERRRECAEQEVLERGLLGEQAATPGKAAHQVQREREDLQRDEHRQQVVRGGEQQHAAQREHRQREDFRLCHTGFGGDLLRQCARHARGLRGECIEAGRSRVVGVAGDDVALGDQQRAQDSDQEQGALQEQCGLVLGDRADDGRRPDGAVQVDPIDDDGDECGDLADDRQRQLRDIAAGPGEERLDEHARDGNAEDDQHRREQPVFDRRRHDVHFAGPSARGAGSC